MVLGQPAEKDSKKSDTNAGDTSLAASSPDGNAGAPEPASGFKLLIEFAPLIVFFTTYRFLDIYWATGVLILASVGAAIASRVVLGKITPMLWMTTVIVVGFGLLTLWLQDPRFIKMKPTFINLLFAGVLAGGLLVNKLLIKHLMQDGFQLTDEGWRQFTIRFIGFFIAMAILNEIIWRNYPESTWVNFKTFAFPILAIVFFVLGQLPVINQYGKTQTSDPQK